MIASAADFFHVCHFPECPHDLEHPLVCERCHGQYLKLKTEPIPEHFVCSRCQERQAHETAIAACNGDKLAEAEYWLHTDVPDWSHPDGNGHLNIDVQWLIDEIKRLRGDK